MQFADGQVFPYGSARSIVAANKRNDSNTMDWFLVVFITFKVVVLGTGMFLAIKWHYDQGKKSK